MREAARRRIKEKRYTLFKAGAITVIPPTTGFFSAAQPERSSKKHAAGYAAAYAGAYCRRLRDYASISRGIEQ
jgi:hypothetical protein